MAQLLWFVLLICVQQSWSQDASSTEASKEDSDPVGVLLSSLRSLVENSGAPFEDGYEYFPLEEGRRKEPMYGKPRQDYFKRIKENYGKIQKNIGSVLGELSLPKKLFGVDVKNKEGSSTVDVKVPFFPVHVKVKNSKTQPPKESVTQVPGFMDVFHTPKDDSAVEKSTKVKVSVPQLPIEVKVKSKIEPVAHGEGDSKSPEESRKVRPQLSKVSTKVKIGEVVKVKVESDAKVVKRVGLEPGSWIDLGELSGSGRGKRDTTQLTFAAEEQKQVFSKAYYDFMANPDTDEDDLEDIEVEIIDEEPNGRILGEVLYSEEAFDNMTKRLIQDVKWALDSDLDPWKIVDKLDAVAKLILSRPKPASKTKRTPQDARLQVRKDAPKLSPMPFGLDGGLTTTDAPSEEREVEVVEPPQETVVTAVTQGGVPVQLRFGSDIENPYRLLNALVTFSRVTIKVPIKSAEEAEIVEIPPPALHVDMSDMKQRRSFMRTLKKFKVEEQKTEDL